MPTTIEEAFNVFVSWLTPSNAESEAAKAHRQSIFDCLRAAFQLEAFFRTGSFGNGTSVRFYSDVDYFAVVPSRLMPQDSSDALRRFEADLEDRFPRTGVHVDSPAIVVPFGTDASENTEIVPAEDLGTYYRIPGRSGSWMPSAPHRHRDYVQREDVRLHGKVRPLIRFIKKWKYANSLSISSFYLETFVCRYAASETTIIYDIDIKRVLARFRDTQFGPIDHVTGISGSITAGDNSVIASAMPIVSWDANAAAQAYEAASTGEMRKAFELWDKIYRGTFPSYG